MKTNMLLDTWDETGTDIEKFKEYVSLIDSATRIVPIETNDLTLFAVIGASDTHIRLLTYDEEQTMRRIVPPASQMKISSIMDKGVTILPGKGAYSGSDKQVLLCAFKQREIAAIKSAVKEIDPDAFLIVCNAHEVLGEGFRAYKKDDV